MGVFIIAGIVLVAAIFFLKVVAVGKTVKLVVTCLVLLAGIFVGVTIVRTGSMPSADSLKETKAGIETQLTDEVKKNGRISDSLKEKIDDYNALVDKAQKFDDNKFFGGLIKGDLEGLKIDTKKFEK